jgi:ribonuclease VapC
MILDSSALIAILLDEPERREFNEAVEAADSVQLSVASYVEISIVLESRFGSAGLRELDLYLARAEIELTDVDVDQARVARRAWSQFGKGRHEAGLNYGDCFAYALARVTGQTLLFKGQDFGRTDVASHRG